MESLECQGWGMILEHSDINGCWIPGVVLTTELFLCMPESPVCFFSPHMGSSCGVKTMVYLASYLLKVLADTEQLLSKVFDDECSYQEKLPETLQY